MPIHDAVEVGIVATGAPPSALLQDIRDEDDHKAGACFYLHLALLPGIFVMIKIVDLAAPYWDRKT